MRLTSFSLIERSTQKTPPTGSQAKPSFWDPITGFFQRLFHTPKAKKPRQKPASGVALSWILPGKLATGALPVNSASLHAQGIKAVLSLCAAEEGPLAADIPLAFRWTRYVLPDSHYSQALRVDQLETAIDILHDYISQGDPVYVHCLGGIERSPLVCMGYLCKYKGMGIPEALQWMKQIHSRTSPTSNQLAILEELLPRPSLQEDIV
jgi:predicted protein tyrosine phosphatase